MGHVSDAKVLWQNLNEEQQALVGGQGADTRTLGQWILFLDAIAAFADARRRALRVEAIALSVVLLIAAGATLATILGQPLPWIGVVALAGIVALALGLRVLWLAHRSVPEEVERFTLPLLRALRDDVGAEARLWLGLRFAPTSPRDDRWLEAALELPGGRLLHLSARDVLEDGGVVCWLRATLSTPEQVEVHAVGEDDPSVSGMTRQVADEAAAAGDPFTSTEMLALKTAHGIQLELARAEAFAAMQVPAPPIGDRVGEASERLAGGRRALAGPEPLLTLWRRATA